MYGGLKEYARREATSNHKMDALEHAFAGAARPTVERRVVVPAQAEQVEIVLRLTQAQANKVRSLLGRAVADKDTAPLYDALGPITKRVECTLDDARAIIFKD